MKKNLFLTLCSLFLMHQILQKIAKVNIQLIDGYLDDILCIPIILYLWNWEKGFLLGDSTYKIKPLESFILTVALALLFELGFPFLSSGFTYDPLDYLAYGLGYILHWQFSKHSIIRETSLSLRE